MAADALVLATLSGMPFAGVRDIEIYFERHGEGDPVVVISGTGGDLRQNPQRGSGLLERNFDVLMYDQRGLGQSGKPDEPYTMADYADDCAALMEMCGWSATHVVGISFGGMVAQHLALRHPESVRRLVLACTSSGGAGGSSFDLLAVEDLSGEDRLAVMLPIMDMRNDLTTDPPTLAPMFDVLAPSLRRDTRPNVNDPAAAMGSRRQLEARRDHDVWDGLPMITSPTYVIGGRYDRQAPMANVERLAGRIPGATLRFFDGGHLFLHQDPAAWPAVVDFLRQG